eukprot:m.206867 g.206867  ORF g.206867 m.206867 type:complete len:53 (+) comp13759_c1_seq1:878-1036(+)
MSEAVNIVPPDKPTTAAHPQTTKTASHIFVLYVAPFIHCSYFREGRSLLGHS